MKKNNNSYLCTEESELNIRERADDEPLFEETKRSLSGLGGWLIVFQLRIYIGIGSTIACFILLGDKLFGGLVILSLLALFNIVCLVMFYRKDINFRVVYIISAVFEQLILFSLNGYFTLSIVIEALIIAGLFKSERVNNTFTVY